MTDFNIQNFQSFANSLSGGVLSVTVENGGTAYTNTDVVTFVRNGADRFSNNANAYIVTTSAGEIANVVMESAGLYDVIPTVSITSNAGVGANLALTVGFDNWYTFASHPTPWANDFLPDPVGTSTDSLYFNPYQGMLGGVKVLPEHVTLTVPSISWVANTVYPSYDNQVSTSCYVVNQSQQVFKCLNNGMDAASIVEPVLSQESAGITPPVLSDGYQWLYLYTVTSPLSDSAFVPVSRANSAFVTVPDPPYAVPGAIYAVDITSGGSGYRFSRGSILTVSGTTVTLSDSPVQYNNAFAGYYLTVVGAYNVVTNFSVSSSAAGGNTLSVRIVGSSQYDSNTLASGYAYMLSPPITATGDGIEFQARAIVDPVSTSVSSVMVINPGQKYSIANLSIPAPVTGVRATLRPILSPPGGHGTDIPAELGSNRFVVESQLSGPSSVPLAIGSTSIAPAMRQFGLLKNPTVANSEFGEPYFNRRITLTFSAGTGFFQVGENVMSQDGRSLLTVATANIASSTIEATGYRGNLQNGEVLTGLTSGVSRTVSSVGNFSGVTLNSGEISCINNISPVTLGNNLVYTSIFVGNV